MRIVIACAALVMLGGAAQAQTSLFSQTPADPSVGFSPAPVAPTLAAPAAPSAAAPRPAAPARRVAQPAPAAAPVADRAAEGTEPAAAPKPRRKPRAPQPARAVTLVNGTAASITGIEITGGNKTVRWTKPIAAQAKAVIKMPALKDCTVTVLATYEGEGPGTPGDVNICKDKTIRLTE